MQNIFILDTSAVIAFLKKEAGGDRMKELFNNPENNFFLHGMNLCEIYYGFYKADGKNIAEEMIKYTLQLPIKTVEDLSLEFIKLVGKYKAAHRISLADAFVLALAEKEKGQIVTADHNEFEPVVQKEKALKVLWIR